MGGLQETHSESGGSGGSGVGRGSPCRPRTPATPCEAVWSKRIAQETESEGLQFRTAENWSRPQESWKFQDFRGREIYPLTRKTKAENTAARRNQDRWRGADTGAPPDPGMSGGGESTLTQKSHDTTHKLGWGVSLGPAKIRVFQETPLRRRLETAPAQAADPVLREAPVEWEFSLTISGNGPIPG